MALLPAVYSFRESRRRVAVLLLATLSTVPLAAQSPGSRPAAPDYTGNLSDSHVLMEMIRREHARAKAPQNDSTAAASQEEFARRVVAFTNAWNALVDSSAKGVWNPKKAKEVHRAFDQMVKTYGWYEEAKK